MTHWLKDRREAIGIHSQGELARRLAEHGVERKSNSISGWEKGSPISLLAYPNEAMILAEVLEWTLQELLSAYYDVSVEPMYINSHELSRHQIEAITILGKSSEKKQKIIMKMLRMLYDDVLEDVPDDLLSE